MRLKNINKKLNKNVNEETELINSLSLGKYLLIYIPILFVMFTVCNFIASLLVNYYFDWKAVLIQAICFAIFFRIFHKIRKAIYQNWNNKYN